MNNISAFLLAAAATVAPLTAQGGIDTFDSGANPNDWTWNGFVPSVVEPTGGNPNGWLHGGPGLFALMPELTSGATAAAPFVGDYRAAGVTDFEFDAQILSGPGGFGPMALMLIDDNGTNATSDDNHAYLLGAISPLSGGGWGHYSFAVPSAFTGALPTGWVAGNDFFLGAGFLPGYDWNDLVQNVTQVKIFFNDPQIFGITQTWDAGVDNLEVVGVAQGLQLSPPTPGLAGQANTLSGANATPTSQIAFAGARNAGSTAVGCTGSLITLDLLAPVLLGVALSDANGDVSLTVPVPAFLSGRTVYLQAVDVAVCGVSNQLSFTFP